MNIELRFLNKLLTTKQINLALKNAVASDMFLIEENRRIFEFICSHYRQYKQIPSIDTISSKFNSYNYFEEHESLSFLIDQLVERKCSIELEQILLLTANILKEGKAFKAIEELQGKLLQLKKDVRIEDDIDLKNYGEHRLDTYLKSLDVKGLSGIPSGFSSIDRVTCGLQNGTLISVIGPTGMGKSFTAIFMETNAWLAGYKPLHITLEMSSQQIANRVESLILKIGHNLIKFAKLMPDEFEKYKKFLIDEIKNKYPSFIISKPVRCTQSLVLSKINEHKPDICVIDYSALMTDERGGRDWQAVSNISKDLKNFASDIKINIPIILLSQVHRGFDPEANELPTLRNIAHSYEVAADSDLVIAINQSKDMKNNNEMMIGVIKNRDGEEVCFNAEWDLDRGIIREKENIDGEVF